MAKRGQGEGSISQRKDGRYMARLSVGDGKRLTFYGETREEVRDLLVTAQANKLKGTLVTGPRQTVTQFLESWLSDVAGPGVRPGTALRYQEIVELHVVPTLGKLTLSKLTPQHLSATYKLLGETLSAATVGHVHRVLHRALETAVRWGYVGRNPCDLVDPPKARRQEMHALNTEQVKTLLAAAQGDELEALYVLALTTGMRQGELLGLKWADVDLAAGTLQVQRSIGRVPGKGWVESEPKTAKGRRSIVLIPLAVNALKRHRAGQLQARLLAGLEWEDRDLVFCNAFGRPIEEPNLRARSFKPLLKKAGLPDIRFHDLRHSAASLLFALGVHPKIVQEQLGHSAISITLDTYSHAVPTLQAEAARKLDALLGG